MFYFDHLDSCFTWKLGKLGRQDLQSFQSTNIYIYITLIHLTLLFFCSVLTKNFVFKQCIHIASYRRKILKKIKSGKKNLFSELEVHLWQMLSLVNHICKTKLIFKAKLSPYIDEYMVCSLFFNIQIIMFHCKCETEFLL